jgi:hypothetical protein
VARRYEFIPGQFAWSFEKCEEEILIGAYDDVSKYVSPEQSWKLRFENHFFDHGNGIAVDLIDHINSARRRRILPPVEIRETDVFVYGRMRDKLFKSTHRLRVWDELRKLSIEARDRRIEFAKEEERRLPAPHFTYEKFKRRRQQHRVENRLTPVEIAKREHVLQAAQAARAGGSGKLTVERATRLLTLASPNMWAEIIRRLSSEDALDVAEKITDAKLRDALVGRSLGAEAECDEEEHDLKREAS